MHTDAHITAFLTSTGIDIIHRLGDKSARGKVDYTTMSGELDGHPLAAEFGEGDDAFTVFIGDVAVSVRKQPKGHYWGVVNPSKPKAISIAEARLLVAAASKRGKPAKPAKPAPKSQRVELEPIDDQIPF